MDSRPAQLLLLGTFHFGDTIDATKVEFDALAPLRQQEIVRLVERLSRFKANVVAVEAGVDERAELNERYAAFREGRLEPRANEVEQIGFRLAARCELERVTPVDQAVDMPFDPLFRWAEANDPEFVRDFWRSLRVQERHDADLVSRSTLLEALNYFNDPAFVARDHARYLQLSAVGNQENDLGTNLLAAWYERNATIFENLTRVAEPGGRIILIIGSGHLAILRDLISRSPQLVEVPLEEYLRT
ncbi:MAG TPA: DUF5694 domain-containing protein [Trueperaceae bacterium]